VFKPVERRAALQGRRVRRPVQHDPGDPAQGRQEQQLLDANLRANAERLRIEQELRLAEQRPAAIIESLPIVLYLEPLETDSPRWPAFISGNLRAGHSVST
jgi:hypothetical protein